MIKNHFTCLFDKNFVFLALFTVVTHRFDLTQIGVGIHVDFVWL